MRGYLCGSAAKGKLAWAYRFWYFLAVKRVEFLGDSLDRIRAFPEGARSEVGFQLRRVQAGEHPVDWKPMTSVGPGVREIRVREAGGAFRVIYLATMPERIVVLHAFEKKTQQTPKRELDLAVRRFRELRE
jgi:phage-related protein